MGLIGIAGRRALEAVPVLFVTTVIVFTLVRLVPGDPVLAMLGPDAQVSQADVQQLRGQLGLDKPWPVQYVLWLSQVLHGDLGRSIASQEPVGLALVQRLPITAELAAFAIVIALLIALPLGMLAATRPNSIVDVLASGASVFGLAVPNFWLAILLVLLLAVHFRVLPASGYVSPMQDPLQNLKDLLLPSVALGVGTAGGLMRQLRTALLEVLGEDYIRTARAKGVTPRRVLWRHALRNALIPVVTVLGLSIAALLGGSLIIESIFLIPGVGSYLVNAIFTRDFPVVQGGALVIAVVVILVNLLVDVAYAVLDPRLSQA